ncbi:hypothetical protein Tco_0805621 [Tanacetum coccineum]
MFNKAFNRVNTFIDFRTNLVEGSSKRAGEKLEHGSTKKQKVDKDKSTTKLQSLIEVIPDEEEVAIDVIPLATKSPSIMYRVFSQMLKSFSREDLEDLYKLVKAKYKSTRLVEDLDLVLWNDLKNMFEPHVEDEVWKLQQRYRVISWKLFDSCGIHCLSLQSGMIYMMVEKRYPLTPPTITDMLNKKLQYKVNDAEGVNAANEEVSIVELVYHKRQNILLAFDGAKVSFSPLGYNVPGVTENPEKLIVLQVTSTLFSNAPVAITSTDVDTSVRLLLQMLQKTQKTLQSCKVTNETVQSHGVQYAFLAVKAVRVTSIHVSCESNWSDRDTLLDPASVTHLFAAAKFFVLLATNTTC